MDYIKFLESLQVSFPMKDNQQALFDMLVERLNFTREQQYGFLLDNMSLADLKDLYIHMFQKGFKSETHIFEQLEE